MDPQAYIDSGVIERYALGQATCYEARELEHLAAEHASVRRALDEALGGVDALALASSARPPEGLRERMLARVAAEGTAPSREAPAPAEGGRVRYLRRATAVAAALVLLAGAAAVWLGAENQRLRREGLLQTDRLVEAEERLDLLDREIGAARERVDRTAEQLALLRDPGTRRVAMAAVGADPDARVDVYWNPGSRAAFYDVIALAPAPEGRQYQLWAIVDGVPQDMGVLPLAAEPGTLSPFPFVAEPQAFAITLEPAGGSAAPTLDAMVVMGQLG